MNLFDPLVILIFFILLFLNLFFHFFLLFFFAFPAKTFDRPRYRRRFSCLSHNFHYLVHTLNRKAWVASLVIRSLG
uniref:Transmembrane protein n=1 Tax=Medicago truncatula TaxID=3880 RepID=B7FFJ6_MEDTR|nr:unknown [Medicago truncatula]